MQPPPVPRETYGPRSTSTVFLSVVMGIFFVGCLLLLVIGFVMPDASAVQEAAIWAAAAVCGIVARIAQAGIQHTQMMDELRRR